MIRALIYLVIVMIGLIASPYLSWLKGYIYIAIGDYELETSLVFAIFAAVMFYVGLVLLEMLVVWSINLILNSRLLPEKWRRKAARKHTLTGALALAEEDWSTAEKAMARGADKGEIPALNLLAAARAAQHRNDHDARDHYLNEAAKDPAAYKAVLTTRVRYLLQQGELTQARALLDELNPTSKSKPPVLGLALDLYRAQEDWSALKLLLPIVKKRGIIDESEHQALNAEVNLELLKQAAGQNEQALEKAWHWLSRAERKQTEFIAQYALGLAKFERRDEAIKLLMKQAKQQPTQAIFDALPRVLTPADLDARKQLFELEKKLGEQTEYQACIAALYDQSKEFRESQKWWSKVCQQSPTKQRWLALAEACEHLGEQNQALQHYRKAAIF